MVSQQFANFASLASAYVLVAIGFTLFFGTINLINFAHGEVYMLGGFTGLWTWTWLSESLGVGHFAAWACALLAAAVIPGAIGVVIERLAYRPVRDYPPLVPLITSVAASMIVREAVQNFVPNGANPHPVPDPFGDATLRIGRAVLTYTQLLLIGAALVLIFFTDAVVGRTKLGRHMRAVCADAEAAHMMGINVDRTIALTFFFGSALGGIAGVMNAMSYGAVRFDMGLAAGFKGFTCAVVGGLGNVRGAIVGGLLLAGIETVFAGWIRGGSAFSDIMAFVMLILVLIIRPRGVLGSLSR